MMALRISASLIANGNQLADVRRTNNIRPTQTGTGVHSDLAEVGTSEVSLGFGTLTNHGWMYLKNLSAYGTISIGPKIGGTRYDAIDLGPGDLAVLQLDPSVAVSAIATQTCVLEWTVAEQ